MSAPAQTIAELQARLREALSRSERVLPVGAGSKSALALGDGPGAEDAGVTRIEVAGLRGMVEYDPAELTFTALAGTSLREIEAALADNGQHLPFDPPLGSAGATLGGTVAAGLAGPGALGGGGVRDFVIGLRMLDGAGRLVAGGGRVVKNAAGFDLPKLMVGSLGRLGVIVEVSCKVFPRPAARATVRMRADSFTAALAAVTELARGPLALDALELLAPATVLVRLSGDAELLAARVRRLIGLLPGPAEALEEDEARALWEGMEALGGIKDGADGRGGDGLVIRIPAGARAAAGLEQALADSGAARRYGLAANVAWVAWPSERPARELGELLAGIGLTGVPLLGEPSTLGGAPLLGADAAGGAFGARIRAALDPHGRFLPLSALGGRP